MGVVHHKLTRPVASMPSVGACCENIQVHSSDPDFSHSKYVGTFQLHVDESGDAIANNEAAIFVSTNPKPKLYVYRSKDGDWVVGTTVGNNKKGVHLRQSCGRK